MLLGSDDNVKLADFGSAQLFFGEEDHILKHRGTFEFMAPECFKTTTATNYYSGRASDIWAVGMTLWVLTFGQLPYEPASGVEVPQQI